MTLRRRFAHRSLVLALVSAALSGRAAWAQTDYATLIETYQSGDILTAVTTLAKWPDEQTRAASRSLDVKRSPSLAKAAVMLHTEVAFALRPDQRFEHHLTAARHLADRTSDEASAGFVARWRVLAATFEVMDGHIEAAGRELSRAIGKGEHSRHAELMRAALQEIAIRRRMESNLRDSWNSPILEREVNALVAAYSRVVVNHPDFLEARLRLGWALFINGSSAGRTHLEAVATGATRPDLRYLAHLFLAALAEREKRLEEALGEYEAAVAVIADQSALVGLVTVASALGDDARIQRAKRSMLAPKTRASEDPWTYYNVGLTGDAVLDSLRVEVQAR